MIQSEDPKLKSLAQAYTVCLLIDLYNLTDSFKPWGKFRIDSQPACMFLSGGRKPAERPSRNLPVETFKLFTDSKSTLGSNQEH